MWKIILFSAISGIGGTTLGGILSLFVNQNSKKSISYMLAFTCGIMISIVFFDLIPESLEMGSIFVTIMGITLGILIVFFINEIVDIFAKKITGNNTANALKLNTFAPSPKEKRTLFNAGVIMLVAISIHNFPEGMAIGTSGAIDLHMGLTLSLLIAIHDIPEGIAICLPLVSGGVKKWKALFFTFMGGSVTVLGAWVGILLVNISNSVSAFALSFAGGAMLYVSFGEMIPQIIVMEKGKLPTLYCMLGIILGLALTLIL